MEEGHVTVDGITHEVPDPFIVIATQNPVGSSGTQLLPESQLDRFMVRLSLGYPDAEAELDLLRRKQEGNPLDKVRLTVNSRELAEMRSQVDGVYVDKKIFDYVIRLSAASRKHPAIVHGASPRASIAVVSMSKAAAFIEGRDYVIPDDVKAVYPATITHRLLLNAESKAAGKTQRAVLDEIVSSTPAPSAK